MNGAVIICYDISCNKRRYRVSRLLQAYGERVLESVFVCRIEQAVLLELQARITKVAMPEDKISYWQICGHDWQDRICQSKQVSKQDMDYFIY